MHSFSFSEIFNDIPATQALFTPFEHLRLTTNESGHREILKELASKLVLGDTLVAVSTFCGLNMAAIRGADLADAEHRIKYLVFLDISLKVEKFWRQIEGIVSECQTRQEAIGAIKSSIRADYKYYYLSNEDNLNRHIKRLEGEIDSNISWLSTDERYNFIREIFAQKRFIFKRIDLYDSSATEAIASALKTHGMKIDTFYLSNMSEMAREEHKTAELRQAFNKFLPLMNNASLIVDTLPRKEGLRSYSPLIQRIIQKIFKQNTHNVFFET